MKIQNRKFDRGWRKEIELIFGSLEAIGYEVVEASEAFNSPPLPGWPREEKVWEVKFFKRKK